MKIKEIKKEVSEFSIKTKCGKKVLKASSEKRLKHNLELHEIYCKECKNANQKNK